VKTIILAGGLGTRLSEYTEAIPKPMVTIGGKPIIWHIMKNYATFGVKDFHLALGYKSEIIKEYFLNYKSINSDSTVDLSSGIITTHNENKLDWKITLTDTGKSSMTGGRVKRLQPFIGNESFLLTYGDGLSNIDIGKLIEFHQSHGKMVTVSAVHPSARFGELDIDGDKVISFEEKPQTSQGWVSGGYFVIEPAFFDFIDGDSSILEREPLERVAELGQLMAYKHYGFWQPMDTKRDRDLLEEMWNSGNPPWLDL
jgi:glucose-1-phosphate cytidylyltransferase